MGKILLVLGFNFGMIFLFSACQEDRNQTKLMYMPDMVDAPVVKPQLNYLEPPEGSVANNAMLYPPADKVEEWEKLLHNPYIGHPKEAEYTQEGAALYHDNCSTCHGEAGKGDGSILDKFPPPPDITNEMNMQRPDGFFFHKITVGGPIMPSRGEQTYTHERWKIILHLRAMQKSQGS